MILERYAARKNHRYSPSAPPHPPLSFKRLSGGRGPCQRLRKAWSSVWFQGIVRPASVPWSGQRSRANADCRCVDGAPPRGTPNLLWNYLCQKSQLMFPLLQVAIGFLEFQRCAPTRGDFQPVPPFLRGFWLSFKEEPPASRYRAAHKGDKKRTAGALTRRLVSAAQRNGPLPTSRGGPQKAPAPVPPNHALRHHRREKQEQKRIRKSAEKQFKDERQKHNEKATV